MTCGAWVDSWRRLIVLQVSGRGGVRVQTRGSVLAQVLEFCCLSLALFLPLWCFLPRKLEVEGGWEADVSAGPVYSRLTERAGVGADLEVDGVTVEVEVEGAAV